MSNSSIGQSTVPPAEDVAWLITTFAGARFSGRARTALAEYCDAHGFGMANLSAYVTSLPEYLAKTHRQCAVEGCPNNANWLDCDGQNRCDDHHLTGPAPT
jgi:hypothetical protein